MNAPQIINVPISYPSHMNAPKSSSLRWMHQNLTPHTWMHWNHHPSSKCFGIILLNILPLTHECTDIIIPQVNAPESYPSHMNAPTSFISQVNAPISYPSHMNAPQIVTPQAVGYRSIYLGSDDRCIHVRGVRFRCIYLKDDDFSGFMCQG